MRPDRYEDPLDRVWIETAARIGLRVARTHEAYASTDGRGTLAIGTRETLDPDDCLAQMIFHELCHSLVEGPASLARVDFGLENDGAADVARERACLRAQAALARPWGLRRFLAPTTEHRAFYDALAEDALAPEDDPTVPLARLAVTRAERDPWAPHLARALDATAAIVESAAPFAPVSARNLLGTLEPRAAHHPLGFALAARGGRVPDGATCASCMWKHQVRGVDRCRQAPTPRLDPTSPACERFEAVLECAPCGACCREGYQAVDVARRDPVVRRHPALVITRADGGLGIARTGDRCAALDGGPAVDGPYTCRIYADRPRTCRDLAIAGPGCLDARRRVGLSR